jgi:transketolase
MVSTALTVAADWPQSDVYSVPCIKPLAVEEVSDICRRHAAVIVLEEHSIYGGLGSAVAEIAASEAPTHVCRIGVRDRFSQYCGSYGYLMREHALDAESVAAQVREFMTRHGTETRGQGDKEMCERTSGPRSTLPLVSLSPCHLVIQPRKTA